MFSLHNIWYKKTSTFSWLLFFLLLPLSICFCFISFIRRKLYQYQLKKSFSVNIPVVIIGNIVVGGSGKTPLIISLTQYLKKKGFQVGIVSRGYGGDYQGVKQVDSHSQAKLVGDEPCMIYQRTDVPLVVCKDRVRAAQYLLANNTCDIILSDDGLQHYALKRDVEVVVVDANKGFGNGYCLPAGPLREKVSRLKTVDMVVSNGQENVYKNGCFYALKMTYIVSLDGNIKKSLTDFVHDSINEKIHVVAGIASPSRFFKQLKENDITIEQTHEFVDHHNFTAQDFKPFSNHCILMTEKDAVKCGAFNLPNAWYVEVDAVFSDRLKLQIDTIFQAIEKHPA